MLPQILQLILIQQQVPQYPIMAPQTTPTTESKQVVIIPAEPRPPAQQASSQSRQPNHPQAGTPPHSYLFLALHVAFGCAIFNPLSLLFGLPAIIFGIMVICNILSGRYFLQLKLHVHVCTISLL